MQLPGRKFSQAGSGYRYGFNGKENDNSTGEGNLDFGARIYDSRLGRWLGVDKFTDKYPNISPYAFCINSPLQFKDANGHWLVDANGNIIYTRGEQYIEINGNVVLESYRYYFYTNDGQAVETLVYNAIGTRDDVVWENESKTKFLDWKKDGNERYISETSKLKFPEIYNCHGNSLDLKISNTGHNVYYIPGRDIATDKDQVSKVYKNKAEFTPVKARDVQPGDIAIFDDGNGDIAHSATVTEVGRKGKKVKHTSKNDRKPIEYDMSVKQIIKSNPSEYKRFVGYYRKNSNRKVNVKVSEVREDYPGHAGKPDGEAIKKILEGVKKDS